MKVDVFRVARVLARFAGRTVRVSTIARALADDFEHVGVDRAVFIEAAGGGRLRANKQEAGSHEQDR